MKPRTWHVCVLTIGILFAASEVAAQNVVPTRLRANPYRDGGGSCVYDRDGKLVNSPRGKTCRDRTKHLGATSTEGAPSLAEGLPPALREDLRQLLSDHSHISSEMTELRNSIKAGSRTDALERADRVSVELADHKRREEEFIKNMSDHREKR